MSHVDRNLIPGEKVLYQTGLHWIALLGPIVAGLFFGLPGLLLLLSGALGGSGAAAVVGLLLLALGGLFVGLGVWRRNATEMLITNKRIVIKTGRLSRKTIELLLSKVESIGVEEPAVGRIFGYGSVVVRGTGGTPEPFAMVNRPLEFRRQVQQQIDSSARGPVPGELVSVLE